MTSNLVFPEGTFITDAHQTNSFIDEEGEVFRAKTADYRSQSTIVLSVAVEGDETTSIEFFKADAAKIIALIQEAASDKPVPKTPEEIADFARRWDARVDASRAAKAGVPE
jgi:hypothetical protein